MEFFRNRKIEKQNEIFERLDKLVVDSINRRVVENDKTGIKSYIDPSKAGTSIQAKLSSFFGRMFSSNRKRFVANSGYNMQRMVNAYETETFIARVIDQYIVSVLQRGWDWVGSDPKAVTYIKKRIYEMEIVSGKTFRSVLSKSINQALLQGNIFVSKLRNIKASSGKRWTRFDGKTYNPIASFDIQDTVAMRIRYDHDKNKPINYYQSKTSTYGDDDTLVYSSGVSSGRMNFRKLLGRPKKSNDTVTWSPDDMVHIKFHSMPGKVWAMPPFQPVLEDILALREIEESIQLLVYQYGHIFLHGTVDMLNAEEKQAEINDIIYKLERMAGNGAIVTGNETQFKAIGAEGKAIRAEGYLNYFQQRVLAGLYTSSIAMGQGETSNRNTADFVDKQKQEVTKDIQNVIINGLQSIFDEFLYESGVSIDYVHKNRVSLWFPDPDITNKIKIEQHAMLMYQSNCITEQEMREAIGKKPIEESERDSLYYRNIGMDELQAETSAQIAIGASKPVVSGTNSNGNSKKKKSEGAAGSAGQTVRPANQHGRKAGPGSIKNSIDAVKNAIKVQLESNFDELFESSLEENIKIEQDIEDKDSEE